MRFYVKLGVLLSVSLAVGFSASAARAVATIDPTHATFQKLDPANWEHRNGSDDIWIVGDKDKPGLCIQLVYWHPGTFSRPHFHTHTRYITVLSGTWWVGTGDKFDPNDTVAMPAGTFVTDFATKVHYDGAKAETGPAMIELVMDCPLVSQSVAGAAPPQ